MNIWTPSIQNLYFTRVPSCLGTIKREITRPLQSVYESIRLRPVMEFIFFSIFPSTQLSFFVVVFHFLMKRDGHASIYDIECSIKAREIFQYFSLRNLYHIIVMSSKLQSCLRNAVEASIELEIWKFEFVKRYIHELDK